MDSTTNNIIELIKSKIVEEWTLAGHSMTGTFEESLEGKVESQDNNYVINIYGNEYGLYLSEGVEADNIPYTPKRRGQGSGGTSKYITGLKNWVQMKLGISDDREALSIAFAIAHKHSEEGMPVRNGQLGSKFLEETREKNQQEIDEEVQKLINQNILKKW